MGFIFGHFVWHFVISIHREFPSIGAIFSQSMLESKNITLKSFENENKIIFSGGSNLAYGINCKKLTKSLNIPVINYGCMVGLGPEIIFENMKHHLNENDKVIFCWEYETYLFERKNRNLNYLGMIEGPQNSVIQNFPFYDRVSLRLYFPISLIRFSIFSMLNSDRNIDKIYKCGWKFDELGNVTSNVGIQIQDRELLATPSKALVNKIKINDDLYEIMREVKNFAELRNIELYATWPNIFKHPKYSSNRLVKQNFETIREFWQNLKIPMIGNPYETMYSSEYFYDSLYHLNQEGVSQRTSKLLDQLSGFSVK